jgi:hypothetical protein
LKPAIALSLGEKMKLIESIKNNLAVHQNNRQICFDRVHTSLGKIKILLEKNLLIFSTPKGIHRTEKLISFNIVNQDSEREIIFGGGVSLLECEELNKLTKAMLINRKLNKFYINWVTFTANPDCKNKQIWKEFYAENCALLFTSSAATDNGTIDAWKSIVGDLPGPTPYDMKEPGQFLVYVAGQKRIMMGQIPRP